MSASARDRGFALVIVLWTLGILALLGAVVTGAGRQEARLAAALRTGDAARAAAEAALQQTCFELLAGRTAADGVPHVVAVGAARATVVAQSERGKINPNTAPVELLATLLRVAGASATDATQVASAIVIWRQPTPVAVPEEMILAPYRAAGLRYGPPGQPFRDLGELRLVLGVTPALFAAVAPHMSVFATGAPDPAQADPVVRQSLELAGVATGPAPGGTLAVTSQAVSISVTARLPDGGAARIDAVVLLDPAAAKPAATLAWSEP